MDAAITSGMERRVTIRDIASTLGLHYSTISLGLRGDSRINRDTQAKIKEAAERLGYRPDPMVKALSVYRTGLRSSTYHATLAWLTGGDYPIYRPEFQFFGFFEGARQRAKELGYLLEEFPLKQAAMSHRRFSEMLQTRGISGILVAPQPLNRSRVRIPMNWSPFSAVSFGYSLAWPSLHSVSNNHFSTIQLAIRQALKRGYTRIGLCLHKRTNDRVAGASVGGFVAELMRRPSLPIIPPLLLQSGSSKAAMVEWLEKHRPDVVIGSTNPLLRGLVDATKASVPTDLGTISLNATMGHFQTGIDQNLPEIGKAALELLVEMINRGERGIPPLQHRLLVEGTWNEGETLQ